LPDSEYLTTFFTRLEMLAAHLADASIRFPFATFRTARTAYGAQLAARCPERSIKAAPS
jgi:hypothetical protein